MKRKIIALMLACAVVLGCTGCVKVIKIGEEGKYTGKAAFNAADAAAGLWEEAVVNIQEKAVELPDFLEEANGDLASLVDKYGKYSMGTSGSISYAVKGTGVVEEVNQEKKAGYMTVKLDGYDGPEVIKIQIGSVYKGSSTRDTLDIVNFGNYTNQHTAIDTNIIQPANPASLSGKTIEFVGTFTVDGNDELLITTVALDVK